MSLRAFPSLCSGEEHSSLEQHPPQAAEMSRPWEGDGEPAAAAGPGPCCKEPGLAESWGVAQCSLQRGQEPTHLPRL